MAKKKPPNWEDIKTRYVVNGEKPGDIAKVYDVSAKTISNRASEEKWGEERGILGKEIRSEAEGDLKALCRATITVHRKFMERMLQQDADGKDMIRALEHPFLTDGERTNSLFQTAMNNSVKVMLAAMREQDDSPEDEPAGFNVAPDA